VRSKIASKNTICIIGTIDHACELFVSVSGRWIFNDSNSQCDVSSNDLNFVCEAILAELKEKFLIIEVLCLAGPNDYGLRSQERILGNKPSLFGAKRDLREMKRRGIIFDSYYAGHRQRLRVIEARAKEELELDRECSSTWVIS
jgi:hypothetical protein